ncbi:hypothetical protein KSX_35140 [Ktedonospora formicarum]|uniref:Uncharacterized protein n=1 Tax=Ktedonospora formicarum TaxID=2778364 RepID=A0A8J3HY56_9CHLR|nr:hypothetical protein KSX_35140 [Ktedonospora formicarum]
MRVGCIGFGGVVRWNSVEGEKRKGENLIKKGGQQGLDGGTDGVATISRCGEQVGFVHLGEYLTHTAVIDVESCGELERRERRLAAVDEV